MPRVVRSGCTANKHSVRYKCLQSGRRFEDDLKPFGEIIVYAHMNSVSLLIRIDEARFIHVHSAHDRHR